MGSCGEEAISCSSTMGVVRECASAVCACAWWRHHPLSCSSTVGARAQKVVSLGSGRSRQLLVRTTTYNNITYIATPLLLTIRGFNSFTRLFSLFGDGSVSRENRRVFSVSTQLFPPTDSRGLWSSGRPCRRCVSVTFLCKSFRFNNLHLCQLLEF